MTLFKSGCSIGLSVSFCVSDIAAGLVDINEVQIIMSSTRCDSPEAWDEVIARYRTTYWYNYPEQAEMVIRTLLRQGKIEQTRLSRGSDHYPMVNNTHWVSTPEDIEWHDGYCAIGEFD